MKKSATIKYFLIITAAMLLAVTVPAQNTGQEGDLISVNTSVGEIGIAIEQPLQEPFEIQVYDNGERMENVKWASPAQDNLLQVVIIVAMNPVNQWKTDTDGLLSEIKKLSENSLMSLAGINLVDDAGGFDRRLKFPKSVNQNRFDNLAAAVRRSADILKAAQGNRKALLVLTNEIESLPDDVIRRTGEVLGNSSLMVYLMSINTKVLKSYTSTCRRKCKVIARTNVNGQDVMIFPEDFMGGLFRSFTRLATHLYTISYDLREADYHRVVAVVKRVRDGFSIAKNIREFKTSRAGSETTLSKVAFYADPKIATDGETAIKDVTGSTFRSLMNERAAKLTSGEVESYARELRRRPELSGVEVLPEDDPGVQKLSRNLAPVLKIFERDNYTRLFVYKGANPFIGLYRESIIVFSTKALELFSDEQLRAAVAHELAHEMFISEMRAADQAGNYALRRIVEHKCDLAAVIATRQLNDDPFAVADAAQIFTVFYQKNQSAAVIRTDLFPSNAERKNCIKYFLIALTANLG